MKASNPLVAVLRGKRKKNFMRDHQGGKKRPLRGKRKSRNGVTEKKVSDQVNLKTEGSLAT